MRVLLSLCVLSLCIWSTSTSALSDIIFRCGPNIVRVGETKAEILLKCGEPSTREFTGEKVNGAYRNVTRYNTTKKYTRGTYSGESLLIETWTYNCGKRGFIYTFEFQGATLKQITVGKGYGRGESDCIGIERRERRLKKE